MPSGTAKNSRVKPSIGSDTRRKNKKGNSTPKSQKKRCTPRFYEVKIRLTAEKYARGQPYFREKKLLTRFVLDAYMEKVNRAEAHDKEARQRALISNMNLLEPILKEMHAQGKLNFLHELVSNGINDDIGGKNGI